MAPGRREAGFGLGVIEYFGHTSSCMCLLLEVYQTGTAARDLGLKGKGLAQTIPGSPMGEGIIKQDRTVRNAQNAQTISGYTSVWASLTAANSAVIFIIFITSCS